MSYDALYVTKHQGVLYAKEIGNQVLRMKTRYRFFMFSSLFKRKKPKEQENL